MPTDPTDRALLDLLRRNARTPAASLARRLGLSRTTLQGRIERLERDGAIGGYTIIEPREKDGLRAHVMITLAPRLALTVERALREISALRELHAISGQADMLAVLGAATPEDLDTAIDAIGAVPGVERTVSSVILSTKLIRGA